MYPSDVMAPPPPGMLVNLLEIRLSNVKLASPSRGSTWSPGVVLLANLDIGDHGLGDSVPKPDGVTGTTNDIALEVVQTMLPHIPATLGILWSKRWWLPFPRNPEREEHAHRSAPQSLEHPRRHSPSSQSNKWSMLARSPPNPSRNISLERRRWIESSGSWINELKLYEAWSLVGMRASASSLIHPSELLSYENSC